MSKATVGSGASMGGLILPEPGQTTRLQEKRIKVRAELFQREETFGKKF